MTNIVRVLCCREEKNAVYKFIQGTFNEYSYCRSVMKKHFNKNLIMSVDEEEEFERSNIFWICGKIIDDNKVREHCHVTGKYRGNLLLELYY